MVGTITQALLYVCYAMLMGSFILYLVPNKHRPVVHVPKKVLLFSLGGIVIFSFIPVLQLIMYLSSLRGFLEAFSLVLLTFETGKSWFLSFIVSFIFFFFFLHSDNEKKSHNFIGILLTFILICSMGWSSHASSISPIKGFFSDTVHFTAVSVWVGVLLVVSWFSKGESNWLPFLSWFTPTAIFCLGLTIISGFLLMDLVVDYESYFNSWMIPYGQALLLKHLLIIPLLVYAMINGVLIRNKLKKDIKFKPRSWVKVESIVILLIFSATAALGQQSPPKETAITNETISKMTSLFFRGDVVPDIQVQISIHLNSIILLIFALLFLVLLVLSFINKRHVILSFCMCLLSVISLYISLMLSME